jgi:hypothetical protein
VHQFEGSPVWIPIALLALPIIVILAIHTIPALVEQRRKKQLMQISGRLQGGYFRLTPLDDEASFTRADGVHNEISRWIEYSSAPALYLTGVSGSGKSSLLSAWVLPHLVRQKAIIVRLRGYQNPLIALEQELKKRNTVWEIPPRNVSDVQTLIKTASQHIRPRRLIVIFDQFEEFVILHDRDVQERLECLFSSLSDNSITRVTFLIVLRSDYIGMMESLSLPRLVQDKNWKEIPPFTESAARDFMLGSGLQVADDLLREVLHEAAEMDQTKGLIRPITINCAAWLSADSQPRYHEASGPEG